MINWWQSIVLGIVEGITEFLPISSTGHLTVVEKLMGVQIDDPSVTAYTAVAGTATPRLLRSAMISAARLIASRTRT